MRTGLIVVFGSRLFQRNTSSASHWWLGIGCASICFNAGKSALNHRCPDRPRGGPELRWPEPHFAESLVGNVPRYAPKRPEPRRRFWVPGTLKGRSPTLAETGLGAAKVAKPLSTELSQVLGFSNQTDFFSLARAFDDGVCRSTAGTTPWLAMGRALKRDPRRGPPVCSSELKRYLHFLDLCFLAFLVFAFVSP